MEMMPPMPMGPPGMMPPGMGPPGMGMPPGMGPPMDMMPPGMGPPAAGFGPPGMGDMVVHGQPPDQERPAKKRKLKGLDVSGLTKLLTGLHQVLMKIVSQVTPSDADKQIEVPVSYLEEEFERHWKLKFDARAVGEPHSGGFLRRFPSVFKVRSNGIQLLVSPAEAPNFEQAAESGMSWADNPHEVNIGGAEFAANLAEQVASFLANLVAEERKAGGAPLPFQYANYEVVQDLLTRIRAGAPKNEEQTSLLEALLDPKPPPAPKEEPDRGADDRDRDDRDSGAMGGGPPRDDFYRDQHDNRDRDHGYQQRDNGYQRGGGKRQGGKGKGGDRYGGGMRSDQRGSDGRSLCRQFQMGRCTYGDTCKFLHEMPGGR